MTGYFLIFLNKNSLRISVVKPIRRVTIFAIWHLHWADTKPIWTRVYIPVAVNPKTIHKTGAYCSIAFFAFHPIASFLAFFRDKFPPQFIKLFFRYVAIGRPHFCSSQRPAVILPNPQAIANRKQ
jgi:hypothetical protein